MLIDCDSCAVRNLACGDCVVTVLLGLPATTPLQAEAAGAGQAPVTRVELDEPERAALAVLAGQGLVPPLRLVRQEEPALNEAADGAAPGTGAPGEHDATPPQAEAG